MTPEHRLDKHRRDSLTNSTDEPTIEHNDRDRMLKAVAAHAIPIDEAPPMRFLAVRKAIVRFARWAGWLRSFDEKDKALVELFLNWSPRQPHFPSR